MITAVVSLLRFTYEVLHMSLTTSLINKFSNDILHHADCNSILRYKSKVGVSRVSVIVTVRDKVEWGISIQAQ